MKFLLSLLIILFSTSAISAVRMDIEFQGTDLKVGSPLKAVLKLNSEATQALPIQKLKNQKFASVLYFYSLSPLIKRPDSEVFESEVKVIFLSVPPEAILRDSKLAGDLELHLGNIQVAPTEAANELLFGTFSVPERFKPGVVFYSIAGFLVVGLVAFSGYKKWDKKRNLKEKKQRIRDEIKAAASYEDVVSLWKRKHSYLETFPHLSQPYENLEKVLFKVQFKPSQTELEKKTVISAYQQFLTESEGGFRGI